MITTTKGIVFHQLDYSDSAVIARIYTEDYGLKSYMVRGAKGKKNNGKRAMLQPLSLVEVTARHKEDSSMSTLRDISLAQPFHSIPFDVIKRTVALFLTEVLNKSIREEGRQDNLFHFVWNAIQLLDLSDECNNFHLGFLWHLTRYLGFFPGEPDLPNARFFDLRAGQFTLSLPEHPDYLKDLEKDAVLSLLGTKFDRIGAVRLSNQTRRSLLESTLHYYRLHLEGMHEVNAHRILEAVLND